MLGIWDFHDYHVGIFIEAPKHGCRLLLPLDPTRAVRHAFATCHGTEAGVAHLPLATATTHMAVSTSYGIVL